MLYAPQEHFAILFLLYYSVYWQFQLPRVSQADSHVCNSVSANNNRVKHHLNLLLHCD
jgi:hypothetical protein